MFTLTAKDYTEYIKLAYELTGPISIWALRIL